MATVSPFVPKAAAPEPFADRSAPYSAEAELAVLGGMLIDGDALTKAIEVVDDSMFYREGNRRAFRAMRRIFERGDVIDPVTLAEELRGAGDLEAVGGLQFLASLLDAVPTAANIEYHAKIVREKAVLRRLIEASTVTIQETYAHQGDIDELLDKAESRIFQIAQTHERKGFVWIKELLWPAMERIEMLSQNSSAVTGVPTGFYDLDEMTAGFQKGDLVIVAARPSMGKTAFTLNIAQHAAISESKCVAFFSLEMSKDSLVQRLLTSEARVDAGRVRTGRLRDDDYPRLAQAAGLLNTAPIFIDDTPGISVLEMRAKARRLKADRDDLAMVVVDYLQLMQSNTKSENRQQEVSEISRGLKALAKELEVPVVALSQLSRAVESRPDKRPMMSDLRECVTGDTRVVLADGRRMPIRELVGATPEVYTISERGRIATAATDLVWSVGRKPVFSVRLASGRRIRATAEHRLRGPAGWVHVSELAPGDRLALARRIPEPAQPLEWPDLRVALLGHLVGDGSYLSGQPLRYTTASEENSAIVAEAARKEFGVQVNRHAGRGNWHQLVLSGNGDRWHPAGVNRWLRELGIFNQCSHEKRLPAEVFQLSNRQVALLLCHLWATDGTVRTRKPGDRGSSSVFFATCSRTLADDVAALLLRLGIVARIRRQEPKRGKPVFTVSVSGSEDQRRFVEQIGGFGPRMVQVERLTGALDGRISNMNVDTLPRGVFGRVRERMAERGVTQRGMAAVRGTSYGGTSHFSFAPSRAVVAEYAMLLEDDALRDWAESDLFWDRVVEVIPEGEEEVFDLTVPGPACWLADGIVSHNSGAIEQDADVIMFLYRPEYYHGPTDKEGNSLEGKAEVIVGKQRNGATGTISLQFIKEFTRFENFTRRSDEYGG
ncbi:MAG TPA: replicative DNA helicase [Longimicrobium sp.]|nr:replicative DNA helicase [Longimicrobium sp.]